MRLLTWDLLGECLLLCVVNVPTHQDVHSVLWDSRRHQDSGWKDQRCCDLNTVHLLVSAMEQYSPWSWCWRHVGSSVPPEEYIWHFDKAALECPRFQGWTADCSSPSETHSRPHLQYISAGLCYTRLCDVKVWYGNWLKIDQNMINIPDRTCVYYATTLHGSLKIVTVATVKLNCSS